MEPVVTTFGILIELGLLYLVVRGGVRTFQRNWIAALLLLLLLAPVWLIWAIVENFMSKPVKEPIKVIITNLKEQGALCL